jgi:LEA14-like dessication related protein
MINAIVTKLANYQMLHSALTILFYYVTLEKSLLISVYNTNSTAIVPAATPIAIYANGLLIGTTKTLNTIPIDGEENSKITLDIPENSKTLLI